MRRKKRPRRRGRTRKQMRTKMRPPKKVKHVEAVSVSKPHAVFRTKLTSWRWTDEEEAAGEEEAAAAPPPGAGQPEAKLATPEEVAMALHHAKQRQIQGQQFPDTLVDATNGQPLHVPGVPGSAHNGVSGVGGIFGVGGLLGPDEPMAMRESEALTLGPSCTCAKCVGSPPVCSGCTCRRR